MSSLCFFFFFFQAVDGIRDLTVTGVQTCALPISWAGFLVTALNLFPVGQLDGGRIAYALFGRHHRVIGKATVAALLVIGVGSFLWALSAPEGDAVSAAAASMNWFVWAGLISFLVGFHHSPPLDDLSPISPGRRVIGIICLVLLVVMTPPFVIH